MLLSGLCEKGIPRAFKTLACAGRVLLSVISIICMTESIRLISTPKAPGVAVVMCASAVALDLFGGVTRMVWLALVLALASEAARFVADDYGPAHGTGSNLSMDCAFNHLFSSLCRLFSLCSA